MSTEESQDDSPEEEEDLQYFVRIGGADLDGTKTVERSLSELDGIGTRTARLVAEKADVDETPRSGSSTRMISTRWSTSPRTSKTTFRRG